MEDNLKSFYLFTFLFYMREKFDITLPMGVLFAVEEYGEWFVNYTHLVFTMGHEYVFVSLCHFV